MKNLTLVLLVFMVLGGALPQFLQGSARAAEAGATAVSAQGEATVSEPKAAISSEQGAAPASAKSESPASAPQKPAAKSIEGMSKNGETIPELHPDVALCHRDGLGFVVAPPAGWVNLREVAAQFGLCAMFVPAGYSFDNAPAVIYPNLATVEGECDPVEKQSTEMLERMRAASHTAAMQAVEPFSSVFGLKFELRYFNDAPPPNNFELAAYQVQEKLMLILVLSAYGDEERRVALGDFMQALDGIFIVNVEGKEK